MGSTYFLAPASNCNEARGHESKGMQVFTVSVLHKAVTTTQAIVSSDTPGLAAYSVKRLPLPRYPAEDSYSQVNNCLWWIGLATCHYRSMF